MTKNKFKNFDYLELQVLNSALSSESYLLEKETHTLTLRINKKSEPQFDRQYHNEQAKLVRDLSEEVLIALQYQEEKNAKEWCKKNCGSYEGTKDKHLPMCTYHIDIPEKEIYRNIQSVMVHYERSMHSASIKRGIQARLALKQQKKV